MKKYLSYNNRNLSILYVIVLILIYVSNVSALGVTPGKTTLDYQNNLEKDIEFSVLNNEHKDMEVFMMVQGELNSSVRLYNSTAVFLSSEGSKSFKAKVSIPNSIKDIPGPHSAEIVVMEIPKNSKGGYVGAVISVISLVHIYVPYPGKYLEADLNVLDAEEGSNITFIVPLINRGKTGVGNARAVIDIYSALNEKLGSVESDSSQIKSGERTELTAKWLANVNPGNYLAKVTLSYDGETRNFEKQFSIGNQALSIESILVNNFKLGDIAKLEILVENRWEQEILNVFANLLIYNSDNQVMADVKSANENIPSLSKKQLIAYWDTVGVSEGEYNGKLMVKYGQKSTDKNLVLKVSEDKIDVSGVGFAIRPKQAGKGVSITAILFILIIILIIVNISWFVYFKIYINKFRKRG